MTRRVGFSERAGPNIRHSNVRAGFWDKQLMPGETILWEGRPGFGIGPDPLALKLSVPAVLGISAFLVSHYLFPSPFHVDAQYIPGLPNDITVPLTAGFVLLYLVIYNLSFSMVHPALHRYALTERRALIWRRLPWPRTRSYILTPASRILYDYREPGMVTVGTDFVRYGSGQGFDRSAAFHRINDAGMVFKLALRASEGTV